MEELLLGLATGLLKALGEGILSKIFGDKSPEEYFQEILEAIREYLHIEIVANDITLIKGTLVGIISQMTIDYVNKKKSGASKQELIAFLTPIEATLDQSIMGPLEVLTDVDQSKGNAQQSLLVYMIGGGMQFSVLQEMALHDPEAATPAKSQYALDIQQYAAKYAPRATLILSKIRTERFNGISQVKCMGNVVGTAALVAPSEQELASWPGGVKDYTFYVEDKWTGSTVCQNTSTGSIWSPCSKEFPAYPKSVSCHSTYISNETQKFNSQWNGTGQLIGAWEKLKTNPLPNAS
jgi:hypothetical protein